MMKIMTKFIKNNYLNSFLQYQMHIFTRTFTRISILLSIPKLTDTVPNKTRQKCNFQKPHTADFVLVYACMNFYRDVFFLINFEI